MNVNSHGIGLSFCKRIAKSLGGDLILNEAIRDGCEFVLKLNLKKLDAPA
jgi:signal transduction histidine kinase